MCGLSFQLGCRNLHLSQFVCISQGELLSSLYLISLKPFIEGAITFSLVQFQFRIHETNENMGMNDELSVLIPRFFIGQSCWINERKNERPNMPQTNPKRWDAILIKKKFLGERLGKYVFLVFWLPLQPATGSRSESGSYKQKNELPSPILLCVVFKFHLRDYSRACATPLSLIVCWSFDCNYCNMIHTRWTMDGLLFSVPYRPSVSVHVNRTWLCFQSCIWIVSLLSVCVRVCCFLFSQIFTFMLNEKTFRKHFKTD